MKNPYPTVSKKAPFLYVTVSGVDLSSIVTTGATEVKVFRVTGELDDTEEPAIPAEAISYPPLAQINNRFTFALDESVFNLDGGRFVAVLYYKGTYINMLFFVYDKPKITVQVR